jgi:chitin disaccharide deacetylase
VRTAIILNADDLGLNAQVNEATFGLMAAGRLRSATILANAPCVGEAVERTRYFPDCSFGVHLNVTQLEPLTGRARCAPLLNEQGQLSRRNMQTIPSPAFLRSVYLEFCAQVEHLLALGVPISHVDSHHHVHTVPYVIPIVKAVQRRYGIRKVRIGKNIYTANQCVTRAMIWKKAVYNWTVRSLYASTTTAGFTEFTSLHELGTGQVLHYQSIEGMVHPGSPSDRDEMALLTSPWERDMRFPVTLISYNQLGTD